MVHVLGIIAKIENVQDLMYQNLIIMMNTKNTQNKKYIEIMNVKITT